MYIQVLEGSNSISKVLVKNYYELLYKINENKKEHQESLKELNEKNVNWIKKESAQIAWYDILENYQNKGFGKYLLEKTINMDETKINSIIEMYNNIFKEISS